MKDYGFMLSTYRYQKYRAYEKIFKHYAGYANTKRKIIRYGNDWRRLYMVGTRTTKENIELIKAAVKELDKPSSMQEGFVIDILKEETE